MVPRENKKQLLWKIWWTNKEYYGIFQNGLYKMTRWPLLKPLINVITLSLSYSAPQVNRAFALCMNAIVSMVLM